MCIMGCSTAWPPILTGGRGLERVRTLGEIERLRSWLDAREAALLAVAHREADAFSIPTRVRLAGHREERRALGRPRRRQSPDADHSGRSQTILHRTRRPRGDNHPKAPAEVGPVRSRPTPRWPRTDVDARRRPTSRCALSARGSTGRLGPVPEQLLIVLKFCLLALVYLFFFRVLRAVWAQLREPELVPATPAAGSGRTPRRRRRPRPRRSADRAPAARVAGGA